MKKLAILSATAFAITFATGAAQAQNPHPLPPGIAKKLAHCEDCGHVQSVQLVKHKGQGGAAGMVGGALVGGLLGNQVGGGSGKTLATVGGAAAGAYAGNEVQKNVNSTRVWVTHVTMKDGSARTFEQQAQPAWKAGSVVKVHGHTLSLLARD